ncbi:hypothetical protein HY642_01275 [Candidatus Woesearchaeota archaeon]|nr:hypothetical protein [Candidatus Woesearchaeota archaeon]
MALDDAAFVDAVRKAHNLNGLVLVVKNVHSVKNLPSLGCIFIEHNDGLLYDFRHDEVAPDFLLISSGDRLCYGMDDQRCVAAFNENLCKVYPRTL